MLPGKETRPDARDGDRDAPACATTVTTPAVVRTVACTTVPERTTAGLTLAPRICGGAVRAAVQLGAGTSTLRGPVNRRGTAARAAAPRGRCTARCAGRRTARASSPWIVSSPKRARRPVMRDGRRERKADTPNVDGNSDRTEWERASAENTPGCRLFRRRSSSAAVPTRR